MISIIVPIYKFPKSKFYLQRNLNSIMNQTYRDFEVIVSDDSDDDEAQKWIEEIYFEHLESHPSTPVIRYIHNDGEKGMANNTNNGINQAQGDLIKILFQDDYLLDESSLWNIVRHFTPLTMWMVTSCIHSNDSGELFNEHHPFYSYSENTIGSPSVLCFRRFVSERFNPQFSWVLDLDLYRRLFKKYGLPKILKNVNVVIGIHDQQTTNNLTNEQKQREYQIMNDQEIKKI